MGQALYYGPQQEVLHIEHGSKPVARPIEVVSATKISRGMTPDTTVC